MGCDGSTVARERPATSSSEAPFGARHGTLKRVATW